jgi:DNA-directed RNA polymerase
MKKSDSVKNAECLKNSASTSKESLEERQMERERNHRKAILGEFLHKEETYLQGGRGSQTCVAKGMLQALVPAVAKWLELHYKHSVAKSNYTGQSLRQYVRLKEWVDDFTMAHIAVTVVLDQLGRGTTFRTPINTVQAHIGRQIEDQAFITYMEQSNPKYFKLLQKFYLHDPVRRYDKKVYGMKYSLDKSDEMDWDFMSEEDIIRVGALALRAVMSIPVDQDTKEGFFETRKVSHSKTKQVNYLAFSLTGIKYRDHLQELTNQLVFKPVPMLCPPNDWSLKERGGYLLPPPRPYGQLVHGSNRTIPSQAALDALNRLQAQPYQINKYIYYLQTELVKRTHEIGCFRSFEKDSWKDEHFPVFSSEYITSLEKGGKEYKRVMRELTDAYHKQKLDEREGLAPARILRIAKDLLDETFWTPWFFDSRLRMYPAGQLSVTGGDYVKALLVNAEPKPINEDTRRELLIAIATSGGFEKVDKADYFTRMEWAEKFVQTDQFERMVLEPQSNILWWKADEPFQFLAYCEEYFSVFLKGYRDTVRVWIGRDMTCSGIQILSCIIGDEKAMRFTNVIPSDTVQDAYGEVARLARIHLANQDWLKVKLDKRETKRLKYNRKHPDEPRDQRMIIEFEIDLLDRGIVKTQVMVTGYGGTYKSKREYILEALNEKLKELHLPKLHPADEGIIVDACIDAMQEAFPQYSELNDWFKKVAVTACESGLEQIKWISPNGSLIVQDYREPLYTKVTTHAATGGNYRVLMVDDHGQSYIQTGFGDVRPAKHGSAIAANFTHTLDGCMLQDGVNSLEEGIQVVTVHDCVYFQPGYCEQIVPRFRDSFYNVVTTPVLESLLEENDLDDKLEMLQKNEVDLTVCKKSPFMFT